MPKLVEIVPLTAAHEQLLEVAREYWPEMTGARHLLCMGTPAVEFQESKSSILSIILCVADPSLEEESKLYSAHCYRMDKARGRASAATPAEACAALKQKLEAGNAKA